MRRFIMVLLVVGSQSAIADTPDVIASGDTITARHRYTMGDNDSKSDATNICFLEAKRKAIEYAGVYVESSTQISQTDTSRKARIDMKTIAAALVSAEMASSTTGFDNGRVFVDCVVNAKVDLNSVKQDAAKIASDPAAKKQIEQQQIALKKLEAEITKIQTQLKSASSQQAVSLRQERTAVFKSIDKLQQKKLEITSVIESKGKDATELVTIGMNYKEVLSLLGQPRSKKIDICKNQSWNYGVTKHYDNSLSAVWVRFIDGVVYNIYYKPLRNCESA